MFYFENVLILNTLMVSTVPLDHGLVDRSLIQKRLRTSVINDQPVMCFVFFYYDYIVISADTLTGTLLH